MLACKLPLYQLFIQHNPSNVVLVYLVFTASGFARQTYRAEAGGGQNANNKRNPLKCPFKKEIEVPFRVSCDEI